VTINEIHKRIVCCEEKIIDTNLPQEERSVEAAKKKALFTKRGSIEHDKWVEKQQQKG